MTVASVIQTIQLIIAPAVMVSACSLFVNSVLGRYAVINERIRLMTRERLDLLRQADGAQLAPPTPENAYGVERLAEIDAQMPQLLARHRLIRDSLLAIYLATIFFLLTMLAIAAASTSSVPVFDNVSLALFLVGTVALLAGVAITTIEVRMSHRALYYEVDRVMKLGR
jgi:hypothetical protein